jgi:hypothetical protein
LLPALLLQPMEFRAVEQLAEDLRDLLLDDAGAVVLDRDPEAVLPELVDLDDQLGQDPRLFAGVERVVDRFLDGGEQRLLRVVEAEQVAVLGEELRDRDLALPRRHRRRVLAARRTGILRLRGLRRLHRLRLGRSFHRCGRCRLRRRRLRLEEGELRRARLNRLLLGHAGAHCSNPRLAWTVRTHDGR